MKISVIICTHNRADSLQLTLQSLCQQTLSRDEFEILVVDNASTDNTKQVTESFTDLPITYIFEPKIGLSQARNTGWQAASSPYVAFLDDDAEATPDWLTHLDSTIQVSSSHNLCVGGRVQLITEQPLPAWLDDSLLFCLGALDLSSDTLELTTSPYYAHGCNMMFPITTLQQHNGFRSALGRHRNTLLSGEETELQEQIKRTGGTILYNHNAVIKHHVALNRLSRRWFLRRMYWEGRTVARIAIRQGESLSLWREGVLLVRQVCSISFITRPSFSRICRATIRLGRIAELLKHS